MTISKSKARLNILTRYPFDPSTMKVTNYSKRLGIVPNDFVANYTNEFVQWEVAPEGGEAEGLAKQQEMKVLQARVAQHGGVLQATVA
jgi:pyrimidine precursor biosynthesis enzyme